jgi:hypothetical protein
MKPIRYLVGAVGFLLVWGFVAVVIKVLLIHFISPGHGAFEIPGDGWAWLDLPGNTLGLLAGIQSFRASVRDSEGSNKLSRIFTQLLALVALFLAVFASWVLYRYL